MKAYILILISFLFFTACKETRDFKKDGGIRLVLEMDVDGLSKEEIKGRRDESMAVLMRRLADVVSPTVRAGEEPQLIIVELPGRNDMLRIRKLLQGSASLSFCETYDNYEIYPKLDSLNKLLAKEQAPVKDSTGVKIKTGNSLTDQLNSQGTEEKKSIEQMKSENPLYAILSAAIVRDGKGNPILQQGPVVGYSNADDTAKVNIYIKSDSAKKLFGPYVKFLWTFKAINGASAYSLVAIRIKKSGEVALAGDIIADAKKVFNSPGGAPQISITMTLEAAQEWKNITRNNIGKSIAMVIDEQVYSYPVVQGEIAGGISSITGNFSNSEADDLISLLKVGALPSRLTIVQEQEVLPGN